MGVRAVCISRTVAAGGEEVGKGVAETLGFRYVDEEIITIVAGEAIMTVAGETTPVRADMSIIIPPHTPHGYKNSGDGILRMIVSFPVSDAVLGKPFSS